MNHFEQMWDGVFMGWAMLGGLVLICAPFLIIIAVIAFIVIKVDEKEEKAKKS